MDTTFDLPEVETINLNAYQNTASDFSRTRYKMWPSTTEYLDQINETAKQNKSTVRVLEVGCGNGKNLLSEYPYIDFEGVDICPNLLEICRGRGLNVKLSDGCDLPYQDNGFDHVFSVAVIHHLSSKERRCKFIEEMIRVCKPGGRIMFQVWATSSPKFDSSDIAETSDPHDRYVLFKKTGNDTSQNRRFYHFFDKDEFKELVGSVDQIKGDISFAKDNWIFEGIIIK